MGKFIEKVFISLVISACIFFLSFSFLTGKFPPKKQDFIRSFSLMKQIVGSQKEFSDKANQVQGSAGQVSLEQIADFQKLSLRRTEMSIELMKIFERIKLTGTDPELENKLHRVTVNLGVVDKDLSDITTLLQQAQEAPEAPEITETTETTVD